MLTTNCNIPQQFSKIISTLIDCNSVKTWKMSVIRFFFFSFLHSTHLKKVCPTDMKSYFYLICDVIYFLFCLWLAMFGSFILFRSVVNTNESRNKQKEHVNESCDVHFVLSVSLAFYFVPLFFFRSDCWSFYLSRILW